MTFDFHEQFKHYPTNELIAIVRSPESYQPAAVDAASAILEERQVTVDELEPAEAKDILSQNVVGNPDSSTDLLNDVLLPLHDNKKDKWFTALLIILGVLDLWILYVKGRVLLSVVQFARECNSEAFDDSNGPVTFFSCIGSIINLPLLISLFSIIYTPIIFYLVYKRKKWGWILLFVDNMISVISLLGNWYFYIKYQETYAASIMLVFFLPTAIRAAFLHFLWRDELIVFFPLEEGTKRKVFTNTALVAVGYMGLLIMFSR